MCEIANSLEQSQLIKPTFKLSCFAGRLLKRSSQIINYRHLNKRKLLTKIN